MGKIANLLKRFGEAVSQRFQQVEEEIENHQVWDEQEHVTLERELTKLKRSLVDEMEKGVKEAVELLTPKQETKS